MPACPGSSGSAAKAAKRVPSRDTSSRSRCETAAPEMTGVGGGASSSKHTPQRNGDAQRGFEGPVWRDAPVPFLGQVRLADVAELDPESALPKEGLLLLFWDTVREPSGLSPDDRGSCRVLVVDADAERLERQTTGP